MSTTGQPIHQTSQQLLQELQNELTNSTQLLRLISLELQKIKQLTSSGGEIEENVVQNLSLIENLSNLQQNYHQV